jgi:diguanylate cyclase (GGDEF)-like protein
MKDIDKTMPDKEKLKIVSEDLANTAQQEKLSVDKITLMSQNQNAFLKFKQQYPENAHSLIVFSLTNNEFPENLAKKLWNQIIVHQNRINKLLGRDAGIAVAALDYLTNIRDILSDPVLIEKDKDQGITEIAVNDLLTGLITRDIFDFILKKEFSLGERTGKALSLAMIDIDDFKKVNDGYGHQKGDQVLFNVGQLIKKNIREMDTAARYGGEEFVVLMPNTPVDTAYDVVQRIRKDIETSDPEGIKVTISVGLAESGEHTNSPEKLVKTADMALYQAKKKWEKSSEYYLADVIYSDLKVQPL